MRALAARLALLAAAAMALAARTARADGSLHGPPAHDPLSTFTRAGIETDVGAFDLVGQRGSFVTVAPRFDWGPTNDVLLRLRVPLQTLFLSGEPARSGIGDLDFRAKIRLYANKDTILVFAGIDEQLPTGLSHLGLGGGAIQATPYVTAGYKTYKLIVYATLGDAVSIHPSSVSPPTYFIDPGTDHEAHEDVGVIWAANRKLHLGAALNGVTVLVPSDFGRSLLSGGANVVWTPTPRWKLSVAGQLPILGEHRFEEKGSFDVYCYF